MEIQATFRNHPPTEELEKRIFDGARKLNALAEWELRYCRVIVDGTTAGQSKRDTRVKIAVLGACRGGGVALDVQAHARHSIPKAAMDTAFHEAKGQILKVMARHRSGERGSGRYFHATFLT